MVYLFLGDDPFSKDKQLKLIRTQHLDPRTEQFNLDILYGKELITKTLQEKLLSLPVRNQKRLVVIKNAQDAKDEVKACILDFAKAPDKHIVLVVDVIASDRKDQFLAQMARLSKIIRFKEALRPDTFALGRQIALRRPDTALRILNQLLQEGERPERILGGLRYVWEKDAASPIEARRRLKLLLNCDIEIKTGRVRPVFALERLVVSLCGLGKPLH